MNTTSEFSLDFAYATVKPEIDGVIKSTNEDFIVTEHLDIEFAGTGEHIYLYIEKSGENTHWVANKLAEFAGIKSSDVGVSGLKDRNAVTRQWFSLYLPKAGAIDWQAFNTSAWRVVEVKQHQQKLRRGQHSGNHFNIVVRANLTQDNQTLLEQKLAVIKSTGVPNYFGPQRFGKQCSNLHAAQAWFVDGKKIKNKREKGLVLSAARSYLFNQLLSRRVEDGSWSSAIAGECLVDNLPSGPMWGRGRLATTESALVLEQSLVERFQHWADALEHQGLKQERRELVLMPKDFTWQWQNDGLRLQFTLGTGQFATSLLRELFMLTEPAR